MITLITGAPGAGKTLLAVTDFLLAASRENRQIVVDGIPELQIDSIQAPPVSEWTTEVDDPSSQTGKKLLFTFPEGSLVVIDEAQRVYRPRAVGSKVPPEVAAFETHRHQGLDFIILTQHPNLIDANVRKLVGRHIHIRELGILGRKVYEWPEVADVNRFRSAPVQRSYKLHKKGFTLYKSASLHVKPQRGIPKGLVIVGLCVPVLAFGIWKVWSSIDAKLHPEPVKTAAAPLGAPPVNSTPQPAKEIDPASLLVEFSPRVPGRPETAPAYDELRTVKQMPVVAGCIKTAVRCSCQTQTGHDAGLDRHQCEAWIRNPPFDPYREPPVLPARDEGRASGPGTRPAEHRPAEGMPATTAGTGTPPAPPVPAPATI